MFDKIQRKLDGFQSKLNDLQEKINRFGSDSSDDEEEWGDDASTIINSDKYQRSINRMIEMGGGLVDVNAEEETKEVIEEESNDNPTSWDCKKCGKTGNTGKFCPECGAPKQDVWVCQHCGKKDNTGNFCTECGSPKNAVEEDEEDDGFIAGPTKYYDVLLSKVGKDKKHLAVAITGLMGRNYSDSSELLKNFKKGRFITVAEDMPEDDAQELVDAIQSVGGDAFLVSDVS